MKRFRRLATGPQFSFSMETNKSLGQHFLKDDSVIRDIVAAADTCFAPGEQKNCHEIGPGSGALTRQLLANSWDVEALEKDEKAVEGLNQTLAREFAGKLLVHATDVLAFDPTRAKPSAQESAKPLCIGNLPYYITSDILLWFCKHHAHYRNGIFMIQNEVADRLNARISTKAYGRLSVRLQLMFRVEKLLVVPAKAFVPPPKVDSAVVRLTPTGFAFPTETEDRAFSHFTTLLFSARRKMLRRSLAGEFARLGSTHADIENRLWTLCKPLGIFPETRPDAIAPTGILEMHRFFWSLTQK